MERSNKSLGKKPSILKISKILCILTCLIILPYIWSKQSRSFYQLSEDKYITIWKRTDGICYIILDKYYGVTPPNKEYIKTTNNNSILLIYEGDNQYAIFNNYGKNIDIQIDSHKYKYYNYNQRYNFEKKYYSNNFIKPIYKYLNIDIKEYLVIINGEKK